MIIELASMFIMLVAIFTILRVRDYLYKKQGFTVEKYEDSIFCVSMFIALLCIGLYCKEKIFILLSLPFLVYLATPIVIFSFNQWKEFLGLLDMYIRR